MTVAESVNEPRNEVIQHQLRLRLLARAVQDQPSQRIRPQAKASDPLSLPILLRAKERGKRPAEPADPPKGKGKKGESQKGKKGDTEKGKTAKGSSKGSTEKGKSKDKHYSKGKGQK